MHNLSIYSEDYCMHPTMLHFGYSPIHDNKIMKYKIYTMVVPRADPFAEGKQFISFGLQDLKKFVEMLEKCGANMAKVIFQLHIICNSDNLFRRRRYVYYFSVLTLVRRQKCIFSIGLYAFLCAPTVLYVVRLNISLSPSISPESSVPADLFPDGRHFYSMFYSKHIVDEKSLKW